VQRDVVEQGSGFTDSKVFTIEGEPIPPTTLPATTTTSTPTTPATSTTLAPPTTQATTTTTVVVCPGDRAVGILESRALMRRSSCRGGTRSSSAARCSI
jgi:hypothetical protein